MAMRAEKREGPGGMAHGTTIGVWQTLAQSWRMWAAHGPRKCHAGQGWRGSEWGKTVRGLARYEKRKWAGERNGPSPRRDFKF
jgi:hypothetical protein